jgi:hypothetical protein
MNRGRIVKEMSGNVTREDLMAAAAGVEMAETAGGAAHD